MGLTDSAVEITHADAYSVADRLSGAGFPKDEAELLAFMSEGQRRVPVYPNTDQRDFTGSDILPHHVRDYKPDMFWTFSDTWPFVKTAEIASKGMFLWGVWAFVDFDWNDPSGLIDHLRSAVAVVPTSVWLERKLKADGIAATSPVRLGVNTDSFKPLLGEKDDAGETITKERLKRAMGFPEDCFLVSMVQMNQLQRKPFDEQLEGVRLFREANPDVKLGLYMHCYPKALEGWDLVSLVKESGLGDCAAFADSYRWLKGVLGYGDASMCKILNATDVLLQGTAGESPGMPLLEAQACATPVLATDFVGITEHVAGGELVKVKETFRPPERPNMIKAVPDSGSIAAGLEKIYNGDRESYGRKGRRFALDCTWDKCLRDWLMVLEEVEKEIERRTLVPPKPSEGLSALAAPLSG